MLLASKQTTKHLMVPSHPEKKFQPKEFYPQVPQSIPVTRELPDTTVDLPITLNLGGGQAILLSDNHNPRLESRDFWADICKRVEKLTETCSDETYGTIVEAKLELKLELWSLYFPTLIDKYGGLKHYKAIAERPMSARSQKTFLTTIRENVTKQLQQILDNPFPTDSTTKPTASSIATRLLSLHPTPTITVKDHTEHLQRHTAILVNVAEDIRRELTNFGITISKVADQAAEDKREIQVIAAHLFKLTGYHPTNSVSKHQRMDIAQGLEVTEHILRVKGEDEIDIDTFMAEGDGDPEDLPEADSSKHKGKKAESAEASAEAAEALSGENAKPFSMPLTLIYTLNEAHLCRCPKCEPEAADLMVEEALEMFRQEQVNIIEDTARAEMVAAYKKRFRDEAQEQAKKEANDQAKTAEGQAFLARVKNEVREELPAEIEANHLPTLRKQAEEELLAQMAQLK